MVVLGSRLHVLDIDDLASFVLTKSFAEMHGGYLGIESTLGVGTTVSIFLPINKSPPSGNGRVGPVLETSGT